VEFLLRRRTPSVSKAPLTPGEHYQAENETELKDEERNNVKLKG
jgi:hypothetical protein